MGHPEHCEELETLCSEERERHSEAMATIRERNDKAEVREREREKEREKDKLFHETIAGNTSNCLPRVPFSVAREDSETSSAV